MAKNHAKKPTRKGENESATKTTPEVKAEAKKNEVIAASPARIVVVGVGGGGCNALGWMIGVVENVVFIAINSDAQALSKENLDGSTRIQIGPKTTGGLGCGGSPEVGKQAATESAAEIESALQGADMVFITAGMGGGTGTGAAPVVAEIAQKVGALTVGVVTTPFSFEGRQRKMIAETGTALLEESVDALIVVSNNAILGALKDAPDISLSESFRLADGVLLNAVSSMSDIITIPGLVNQDLANIRTIMKPDGVRSGRAMIGVGAGKGPGRAVTAAEMAVSNPFLDRQTIAGAKGLIVNISGGNDMTLHEVRAAVEVIQTIADAEAQVIFGAVIDNELVDEVRVTVLATSLGQGR